MTFRELSEKRFSVRSYTEEEVGDEQLEYVLECARLAPSAVNRQPWHFYVVRSGERKENLRKCYDRDWFRTAPAYIVCTVLHDEEWVRKDGKEHGNIDMAIATEHICLAAAELGLGTCWVCNFDVRLCHQVLSLPVNEEAAVLIPIGHPAVDVTEKTRKPIDRIVSYL